MIAFRGSNDRGGTHGIASGTHGDVQYGGVRKKHAHAGGQRAGVNSPKKRFVVVPVARPQQMQQHVLLLYANSNNAKDSILADSHKQRGSRFDHGVTHAEIGCHHPVITLHDHDKLAFAADGKHATMTRKSASN